jgi:peptidyl-prolyl cis-trans isomerase A (cyclophilin A)
MPRLLALIATSLVVACSVPATAAPKAAAKPPVVTVKTNLGSFKVELDPEKAPITVENFLKYVDDKFYDGTIFHRVIGSFMVQGGGFTRDMQQKPTKPAIKNEAKNGLSNVRGTIAMARTNDPDSATAQFFVNVVDNGFLNPGPRGPGYAVFGKVVSGMEVVDKIKAVKTGVNAKTGMPDVPVEPVVIESVRRDK